MPQGTVIRSTGSRHIVRDERGGSVACCMAGRHRPEIRATNPVAVGDHVLFSLEAGDTGVITEVKERKNYIIRRATRLSSRHQVVAANIDRLLLFATLRMPETSLLFLDRILVTAEAFHIPAHLVFNKTDLCRGEYAEKLDEWAAIYKGAGYPCHRISVLKGENLVEVSSLFAGSTLLLAGNSGVGKSSLLNALNPSLRLRTDTLSRKYETGRHTTPFAEMYEIAGGFVIDTPGIRSFGIIDIDKDELAHYFPEMRSRMHGCRFHSCRHLNEPGCAVLEALSKGEIAPSRHKNYGDMYHSDNGPYRRKNEH